MAMKEIKSINVDPSDHGDAIRVFQSFGWEYKNEQEVKTNDSQILTGRDSEYEYYKTIRGEHYIRLTFERDPAREHYDELKSLEVQYYEVRDPYYPTKPSFITILWAILVVVGFILYVVPGVIMFVLRLIFYFKGIKEWNEDCAIYARKSAEARAKREEILTKAQALV